MSSGAAWLTGRSGGTFFGPPQGLPRLVDALGTELGTDAWQRLVERAAARGWRRKGTISCGGATRLMRAADGWVALSLARADDRDVVPAWLELDGLPHDAWGAVEAEVPHRSVVDLERRAVLLGLPFGIVPTQASGDHRSRDRAGRFGDLPVAVTDHGPITPGRRATPLVVDLSSLWAGPLCTRLLVEAGWQVVKVESSRRPDAARSGDPGFFDLLHAGKRSVALDFDDPDDRWRLQALVRSADVVVEGSRPRALRQLGIDAENELNRKDGPSVWVSITAWGRTGDAAGRVGFGDDVAAAAGLVVADEAGPCFCVDAIADPLAGMAAAAAVRRAWRHGGRWLVDVAMHDVAAAAAGPASPLRASILVPAPQRSAPKGTAAPFGSDSAAVLRALSA